MSKKIKKSINRKYYPTNPTFRRKIFSIYKNIQIFFSKKQFATIGLFMFSSVGSFSSVGFFSSASSIYLLFLQSLIIENLIFFTVIYSACPANKCGISFYYKKNGKYREKNVERYTVTRPQCVHRASTVHLVIYSLDMLYEQMNNFYKIKKV